MTKTEMLIKLAESVEALRKEVADLATLIRGTPFGVLTIMQPTPNPLAPRPAPLPIVTLYGCNPVGDPWEAGDPRWEVKTTDIANPATYTAIKDPTKP